MRKEFDDCFLIMMAEEGVVINKDGTVSDSGYVNDKDDRGGETKFGISKKFLGYSPRSLTLSEARHIYYVNFWLAAKCDKILEERKCQALALMLFDAAVNQGVGTAVRMLQRALGVEDDGMIGPITLGAIDPKYELLNCYKLANERNKRYAHLAIIAETQRKFLPGWIIRVSNILKHCTKIYNASL